MISICYCIIDGSNKRLVDVNDVFDNILRHSGRKHNASYECDKHTIVLGEKNHLCFFA